MLRPRLLALIVVTLGSSLLASCTEAPDPWLEEDDDGDGLVNGEEQELGTDPASVDSDGDGYLDPWEIAEGTDPTDAESVIYLGGWPYQPDKDAFVDEDNTISGVPTIDELVPRIAMVDQFGEEVDLYDYAGQGKLTVVDLSAQWCGPCKSLASYIAGKSDGGWSSYLPTVPTLVEEGTVQWVTILVQDNYGNSPDETTTADWYDDYPDEKIAVLADDGTYNTIAGWYPTFILVDETMTIISSAEWDDTRYLEALFYLEDEFAR